MKSLSPTDALFLMIEQRRQPMHVAGLHIYAPPIGAGKDFVKNLVDSWRKHLHAVEPFNLKPVSQHGVWHWEVDTEFDLDNHFFHLALPWPGRVRELLAQVSQLHGALLDRSGPLWEMYVIEGLADGRFALYVKIHHALIDGVAGTKLILSSLSQNAEEMKLPIWAQEQPKRAPRAPLPPSVQRLTQPLFDAIRIGGEILPGVGSGLMDILRAGKSTGTMAMPFQAPPTLFNVPISESRRFAAQSYSLARLKHLGQTAGATVNDVTLAICAGALRKYLIAQNGLPEKPLIAMVPVSLHGETKKDGNQVGMILVNLATHIVDPVERLRQIVQSTTEAKLRLSKMSRLQKIAHAAAMLTPFLPSMATGHARKHPIFNVVISNVPGPTMPLYLDGAQLDELYPVSIPADYMALNITVSGYGDHLGFGFTACRRSVPVLQRMLDYTAESFVELEEALHPEALHPSETEAAPAAKPRKRKSPAKTAATRAESESV